MRNRPLYRLLSAAALVVLAFFSGACARKTQAGPPGPLPSRIIEVAYLEGDVKIDDKVPEFGDRLGPAFSVSTGPGSRCDIVFGGGNAVSVGQNAFVYFDFTRPTVSARVDRGGLSSVLKKLDKLTDADSFAVRTETAIAGVRGTSFCVWVDSSSMYVCACNGRVRTIDAQGSHEELLEAAHHVARLYTRTGAGISEETAGMLHHDDASIQSVADRIGYVIDWTRVDE